MADIKKTGVQLVAEGAEEFKTAMDQAAKAEQEVSAAAVDAAQKFAQQDTGIQALARSMKEAGASNAEIVSTLRGLGLSASEAKQAVAGLVESTTTHAEAAKADATATNAEAEAEQLISKYAQATVASKKEEVTATQQSTQAVDQNTQALVKNSDATKRTESDHANFYSQTRAGRIAIAAITTEMALMTLAAGETLPAGLREAAKGIQQVIDTATIGFLVGGGVGALIGAAAGGVLALATAATTASEEVVTLNKELDSLAKKDDVVTTLAQVTGWTKEDAQAMLDLAKASPEAAKALQQLAEAKEPLNELQLAIKGIGVEFEKLQALLQKAGVGVNLGDVIVKGLETAIPELKLTIDAMHSLAAEGQAARDSEAQVAESMLKQAQAAHEADLATDALITRLTKIGQGDPQTQLAQLATVTEDVSKRFLTFADTHREVAAEAATLAQKIQTEQEQIARLKVQLEEKPGDHAILASIENLTGDMNLNEEALRKLVLGHQDYTDVLKQAAAAQDTFDKALENANQQLARLNERTAEQRAQAQQSYSDTVADAVRSASQQIENAEQSSRDRSADTWQKWSDKVADINSQLADKVADINSQLTDRLADIQTQLGNRISDIQTQLADRLAQIDQELANRKADLAHSYQDKLSADNQKIAQAAQDLADKLYQIERTRVEATEALAFSTHEQLETAQTDHDRNRILERARFEQSQIDQRANDARTDAEKAYQEKLAQIEQEKKAAYDEYQYELALAERLAAQKRAEAQRTAAEQIAVAERNAAQQIAIAQREAAERLAIAQREAAQQQALAERQRQEELASIQRSLQQQIAAARQAESNKLADAGRALAERNAAIAASYKLEREQIDFTVQKAVQAYNEAIKLFAQLMDITLAFAKQLLDLSQLEQQMAAAQGRNPIGEGEFGNQTIPHGAGGLDMLVPPGYPNDSFPVMATSGERVTITPPSVTNNSSAKSVTFNIYDATDPHKIANAVDDHLASIAWS